MTAGSSAPDFSAPARRPSERLAIVEFVASTATLEETDYLEWKSAYDLTTKPGAAAIARQLIGFANRDPIKAARHAGGLAYVLVGAQAGSVIGAPHWDSADIENWLAPFVQPELSYDVHYVPIDDELVLFITVEPPRQGDPIFALQRSSEDPDDRKALAEGTIFVRHGGKTERHTAGDLQRLTARAQKTDGPTLAVDVAVKSSDLHAIAESRSSSAACERYTSCWRPCRKCKAPLQPPSKIAPKTSFAPRSTTS